jgi:serine/threonine protein kinase
MRPTFDLCWTDKLFLAMGCARGLAALHSLDGTLCHRDVKSFNFLVDEQLNTKIADLELGVELDSLSSSSVSPNASRKLWRISFGQSPTGMQANENALANWMAPEVLKGAQHTQAADVYSLGLVLYEIVSGLLPFTEYTNQAGVRAAGASGRLPALPANTPEEYARIVRACWDPVPLRRPRALDVADDLFLLWQSSVHSIIKYVNIQIEPEPTEHPGEPVSPTNLLRRAFSFPKVRLDGNILLVCTH